MAPLEPILLDVPPEILTERLAIRAPEPGTGAALNEAVAESLDSLRPWMPWAQRLPTVEEHEALVRTWAADFVTRRELNVQLWCRDTGALVGVAGLVRIDWRVRRFEIGYWCRDAFVGRGLVTEAVRALTRLGFEQLGALRMEIRCDTRNRRSAAVAERAGYVHESIRRCDEVAPDGTARDTHVYRLVRAEYEALGSGSSPFRNGPSRARGSTP